MATLSNQKQDLINNIYYSVNTLQIKMINSYDAFCRSTSSENIGFEEIPNEEEDESVKRVEDIFKKLEEIKMQNNSLKSSTIETLHYLNEMVGFFEEVVTITGRENEQIERKKELLIQRKEVLERRKTSYNDHYEFIDANWRNNGFEDQKGEHHSNEEIEAKKLTVEEYLGKEYDNGITYERFKLTNGKTLYVNVWKEIGSSDRSVFSRVFQHNDNYLINVLVCLIEENSNGNGDEHFDQSLELVTPETNKNYVVTNSYFYCENEENEIIGIPLVLPFPSFINQNIEFCLFNNFCSNEEKVIIFYK